MHLRTERLAGPASLPADLLQHELLQCPALQHAIWSIACVCRLSLRRLSIGKKTTIKMSFNFFRRWCIRYVGNCDGDRYAKHFEVNSQAPRYLRYLKCPRSHYPELVLTCGLSGAQQWYIIATRPARFGIFLV